MLRKGIAALVAGTVVSFATVATAQVKEIPWGTSAVGSSGHRALVNLATVLNREMKQYQIAVQPTPGAIATVKGYATGQFLGYYGADIAFYEYATNSNRFKGFKAQAKREPVQSFWSFTLEVGIAIHSRDKDKIKRWTDLSGKRVFTGPPPWDTRAQLERAMATAGVKHEYVELDLATVGSQLEAGQISGFIIYTNAEAGTAPWITEASLAADWAGLNPSAAELDKLKKAGFTTFEASGDQFKRNIHVPRVTLLPFYYGLHVGLEIPADEVYRMLTIVEKNIDELVKLDKGYSQLKAGMPAMQKRGVASSIEFVKVHPGLARYMRERNVWDAKWNDRIAAATN
jgi:TRAP-type uncharacterized transport system substrate-binding protein